MQQKVLQSNVYFYFFKYFKNWLVMVAGTIQYSSKIRVYFHAYINRVHYNLLKLPPHVCILLPRLPLQINYEINYFHIGKPR